MMIDEASTPKEPPSIHWRGYTTKIDLYYFQRLGCLTRGALSATTYENVPWNSMDMITLWHSYDQPILPLSSIHECEKTQLNCLDLNHYDLHMGAKYIHVILIITTIIFTSLFSQNPCHHQNTLIWRIIQTIS